MRYRVSPYRSGFVNRTDHLIKTSQFAGRKNVQQDVRDLAFQCAILQTSAAMEEYTKSIFEAWAFKIRTHRDVQSNVIPIRTRVVIAKGRLAQHFSALAFNSDEDKFLKKMECESDLWPFLHGTARVPENFDGHVVFSERKYPSSKNMKILFSRIGIDNIFDLISGQIRADAEYRLESFNSVRTALAHSSPPQLTYLDVKRNIKSIQGLIAAVDRILYKTLSTPTGAPLW